MTDKTPPPGESELIADPKSQNSNAGVGGELFSDPKHIRSDCQTVVKMLSLGGIAEQKRVEKILEQGYMLAEEAAKKKRSREWASIIRMITALAKLDQRERFGPTSSQTNIQNNLIAGEAGERAIDRKRQAEAEAAELRLEAMRSNLFTVAELEQVFDIVGAELQKASDKIGKLSPPAQQILLEAIDTAERNVNRRLEELEQQAARERSN